MRAIAVALLLLGTAAHAHTKGFHKRLLLTVAADAVAGVVVMDIDSGERSRMLRLGADSSRDGKLSPEETRALEQHLATLATHSLKLSISGYPLEFSSREVKLSLRDDLRASDSGLSIAVLFEAKLPSPPSVGMTLLIEDASPDASPVVVEVSQISSADGGATGLAKTELESGGQLGVRLEKVYPGAK